MNEAANTSGFSEDEMRLLASVLDEIIPSSDDGRLPGAGQVGVAADVDRALRSLPDLRAMITQGLADLDSLARTQHGRSFTDLAPDVRQLLVREQGFVMPLTLHAFVGYYQNAQVAAALGLEPRPPHPQGYTMEPNDLTLLDPVRRRPKFFRQC